MIYSFPDKRKFTQIKRKRLDFLLAHKLNLIFIYIYIYIYIKGKKILTLYQVKNCVSIVVSLSLFKDSRE